MNTEEVGYDLSFIEAAYVALKPKYPKPSDKNGRNFELLIARLNGATYAVLAKEFNLCVGAAARQIFIYMQRRTKKLNRTLLRQAFRDTTSLIKVTVVECPHCKGRGQITTISRE